MLEGLIIEELMFARGNATSVCPTFDLLTDGRVLIKSHNYSLIKYNQSTANISDKELSEKRCPKVVFPVDTSFLASLPPAQTWEGGNIGGMGE
jgi:hypothetical protein